MSRIFLLPLNLLPALMLSVSLSACGEMPKLDTSSFDIGDTFSVYRQDIRQGNYITQDMVAQLKPGLTREQVRYVLGTPLVTDPFHGSRWDYVYRYDNGKGDLQKRNFSVYFDDDNKLQRVGGDVAAADPNAPAQKVEAPKPAGMEVVPAKSDVTPSDAPAPKK